MMKLCLVEYKQVKYGFTKYLNSVSYLIRFYLLFLCLTYFEERYANRLSIEGLQMFSLGKSTPPYTIAAYIKGKKVTKNFIIYFVL